MLLQPFKLMSTFQPCATVYMRSTDPTQDWSLTSSIHSLLSSFLLWIQSPCIINRNYRFLCWKKNLLFSTASVEVQKDYYFQSHKLDASNGW